VQHLDNGEICLLCRLWNQMVPSVWVHM